MELIIKEAIEKLDKESDATPAAKVFVEYLKAKIVSDLTLAQNIMKTDKTLKGMLEYIKNNAKKKAVSGFACVEDSTVFKWTENYFGIETPLINDDDIEVAAEAVSSGATTTIKDIKEKPEKPKKAKKMTEDNDNQISLLDMLGADLWEKRNLENCN